MNTAYLKPNIRMRFLKPSEQDTDKSVKEMLKTWDVVNCHYCGKEISMLNGKLINNGQHFVCGKHLVN